MGHATRCRGTEEEGTMSTEQTFVIVGASLAGAKAAQTLRDEGFTGRVILVGEEPVRPYERPPLSKTYLRGEVDFDAAAVHAADFYAEHDIDLRTSTTVTAIDTTGRRVTLDPGGEIPFDALLLTTGAAPRQMAIAGAELPGLHYLRSLASCDALRQDMATATKVVVVGAGWIGSEVAASARQLGKDVVMIEAGQVPLERVLGGEVGAIFRDLHLDHGVELRTGVGVQSFRGGSAVEEVVLADGSTMAGDLFVVGIGVEPRTELAEVAGLALDNGVAVDEHLATSAPGVWAAGDVANAYHPLFGTRIRLEHWSAALNQGPVAAKSMLGQNVSYDKVPYFFSDQYDLGLEYSGFAPVWDDIVYRGDKEKGEVIVFWRHQDRVVAGMNINVWDVADDIAGLVRSGRPVDAAKLADPAVALESVAEPNR
jgi:3-phenylpropionate/trans-cinnamate dioxygenase ferredoxin reductase subunit